MSAALIAALAVVAAFLATASSAIAGGWVDTTEIAPAGGAQPSVTMTPQGDVVVAWRGDVSVPGPHTRVFRRVKPLGQGLDAVSALSGDLRKTDDRPATATDAQGRPWIAYHGDDSNTIVLLRGDAGDPTSFSGVTTFTASGSITDGPQLAVGSDAAAVTYKDGNTLRLGTWSQTDGAADVQLRDATNGEPLHAQVTLDDAGNVMTAWTRDQGFGNTCLVETRRRAAAASLSAIQPIGSAGTDEAPQCFDNDVDLALGPTGRVLASWYDEDTSEVRYALAAPGATFGSATLAAAASTNLPSRVRGLLGASDNSLLTYMTDVPLAIDTVQRHTGGGTAASALDVVPATVSLARNATEAAVGAWSPAQGSPCPVSAAIGTVASGLGSPVAIGSCGANLDVAIDTAGDAAAVWDSSGGVVTLDIYDNTPPGLANVAVPATAVPGAPVPMSATASDGLSPVTIHWHFGDGSDEAEGDSASHAYADAGSYTVEIDAIDQGGNVTSEQRTVNVSSPQSGGKGGGGGAGNDSNGSPSGSASGDGPAITVRGSKLSMNRKGVVAIKLVCPAGTDGSCSGPVSLELGAQAAKVRVLGRRAFSAPAGGRVKLKLKLGAKSRKLVLKKKRVKATLRIAAHDRLGRTHTTLKVVSIRAAKRK